MDFLIHWLYLQTDIFKLARMLHVMIRSGCFIIISFFQICSNIINHTSEEHKIYKLFLCQGQEYVAEFQTYLSWDQTPILSPFLKKRGLKNTTYELPIMCIYAKVHVYLWFTKAPRLCYQRRVQELALCTMMPHTGAHAVPPAHTSGLQMLLSEFPRLPAMTLPEPCFMSQTLSLLHMKTVLDSSAASASQWKRLIAANKYY